MHLGLWRCTTVISNLETLTSLELIYFTSSDSNYFILCEVMEDKFDKKKRPDWDGSLG